MNFNVHSNLTGAHSFLAPSKPAWLNYDEEKLVAAYNAAMAAARGTEIHDLAKKMIRLGIKLPSTRNHLNQFVNDAIGYRMTPEQTLFYSYNAFGTCDAICFRNDLLRIHDLKTGTSRISMDQLEIYAALFCLEYDKNPTNIEIELRVYQSSQVTIDIPTPPDIRRVMEIIKLYDEKINSIKEAAWTDI
jgi:hypothetical protein